MILDTIDKDIDEMIPQPAGGSALWNAQSGQRNHLGAQHVKKEAGGNRRFGIACRTGSLATAMAKVVNAPDDDTKWFDIIGLSRPGFETAEISLFEGHHTCSTESSLVRRHHDKRPGVQSSWDLTGRHAILAMRHRESRTDRQHSDHRQLDVARLVGDGIKHIQDISHIA